MKITIDYVNKSYGNILPDDPVDVTISSGPWGDEFDVTKIRFTFSEETYSAGLSGLATIRGGSLELPTDDARKLATAILWHLEQPKREKMRLEFKRPRESDDDNAD